MNFPVMNFPVWKCICFIYIPYLEVPDFIWTFEFPWLEALNFIWISMFGSAKFHMKFLAWTCKVSFQTAKIHMNFSVWKCQISYEFTCLEVRNFIWTFEIPWLEGLNFIPFLEVLSFIWTFEIPFLEVPNLKWFSLFESTQFHMKLIVWKYPVLYE